ncbi:hypothetical protein CRG98_007778 [Punica granatum]|uniref:Uncharacterized protein n=1 Tax=Punica granatum TaxID=22663 RepID=A0A2I0KTR1_PUNGR|nr:hypothetical protein CRG98_007778 [Punica granatum]
MSRGITQDRLLLYGSECGLSSRPACALFDHATWKCPPSRGCVTDTGENESPLPVYDPKIEGRTGKSEFGGSYYVRAYILYAHSVL